MKKNTTDLLTALEAQKDEIFEALKAMDAYTGADYVSRVMVLLDELDALSIVMNRVVGV